MVPALLATIALILLLSGIAFKYAVLPLAASIPWIIFAFLMFDYAFANAAINTALLLFGGFMALLSALTALGILTSNRRAVPEEDEQEAYKKDVLRATRRR